MTHHPPVAAWMGGGSEGLCVQEAEYANGRDHSLTSRSSENSGRTKITVQSGSSGDRQQQSSNGHRRATRAGQADDWVESGQNCRDRNLSFRCADDELLRLVTTAGRRVRADPCPASVLD